MAHGTKVSAAEAAVDEPQQECWSGIPSPPPPCLMVPCCWRSCETSQCCRQVGKCGPQRMLMKRGVLTLVASLLSLIGLIFLCLACGAISNDKGTLEHLHWGRADAHLGPLEIETYMGLNSLLIKSNVNNLSGVYDYDSINCLYGQTTCEKCKDQAKASVTTIIMATVTQVPQLLTDIQRSTVGGDLNCQKFMGMATGIFGFVVTMIAIQTFNLECFEEIPSAILVNVNDETVVIEMDSAYGPGFILLLVATVLKIADVIVHALLPTPQHKTAPPYSEWPTGQLKPPKKDQVESITMEPKSMSISVCAV
ncbi:uncharacterized protein MONBRDRAFT_12510 [Monosiga brevicollis MX1]|uniref:Uncharacterized protein n=1 Tax=Monosiga brevicollis TaxID=81824 RepID=A9VCH9_MONBE|nr:uncharacterized protein MONBRDRAFT_12510 [Monosiga brevicollis MX1]EDQ84786.1 predicted protein [Monosiga brevicollis MX1]|eukprot:XP_001750436.1 hypothetical protein [Monosiga brevicollis MX1]